MNKYYHLSPLLLEAGSIIKPGNWGRIINSYSIGQGQPWIVAREFIFETIRSAEFNELPSRFSSSFVFESLDDANKYKKEFTQWNSLYEVEIVSPDLPMHRAGFNHISFPNNEVEFVPVTVNSAKYYWKGEDIQTPEIITHSPLKILSLISTGPGCYQP